MSFARRFGESLALLRSPFCYAERAASYFFSEHK